MNSVLSFKSDQRTLTGPEAAAAKKYLTLSGSSGVVLDQCTGPTTRRQQAICIFTSKSICRDNNSRGAAFSKAFSYAWHQIMAMWYWKAPIQTYMKWYGLYNMFRPGVHFLGGVYYKLSSNCVKCRPPS